MPAVVTTEALPPTSPSTTHRRASLRVLSRNIDKVTLGNLSFPTWYYSPYPDSILYELDAASSYGFKHEDDKSAAVNQETGQDGSKPSTATRVNGSLKHSQGSTTYPHQMPVSEKSVLDNLYVCPYCFRYTHSSQDYTTHIMLHIKTEADYYLPTSRSKARRKRRSNSIQHDGRNGGMDLNDDNSNEDAPKPVPDSAIKVYSYAGYTVWDVDGETEKLYCQNLSLFGKLFLEQKSVFFDTSGFHYFVLTYTPPSDSFLSQMNPDATADGDVKSSPRKTSKNGAHGSQESKVSTTKTTATTSPTTRRQRKTSNTENPTQSRQLASTSQTAKETAAITLSNPSLPLRHQVLGFFSKETLSWDANNLACILVFPPYQHRNLGQLLMSVSYKLSGWEWEDSIIGGPEKPLSTMGRKSYLRFWSERVARFVMGQSADADGLRVFEVADDKEQVEDEDGDPRTGRVKKVKKRKRRGKGPVKETISVRELGDRTGMLGEDVVAALTEMGVCDLVPPKRKKIKKESLAETSSGKKDSSLQQQQQQQQPQGGDESLTTMIVYRTKVLDWAKMNGVDMVSPVREEGFLGEWALSEEEDDDADDNEKGTDQDAGSKEPESE